MSVQEYYNILPMKSPAPSPTSSEDSGVPIDDKPHVTNHHPAPPMRPPRARDEPPEHAYHNLPPYPEHDYQNDFEVFGHRRRAITPPPPRLPKRQPLMARPQTPPPPVVRKPHYSQPSVNQFASPRLSSVSSFASATTTTTAAHCQPFRRRFQVKKRRTGGPCKCKTPTSELSSGGRDDVILLYSRHCSGAIEWAKYLHKLYTELSKHKGKLRVRHLPLEDVADCVLPAFIEEEIYQSRLQIVLLSPTFLEFTYRHPSVMVGRLLNPDRVIAIMLGVKDDVIKLEHRTCLVSFSQWIHLEAKDHDLEFVQTVLYFSTQILQRSSTNEPKKATQKQQQWKTANGKPESNFFHIHPRKATESQNRVLVIFESPQSFRSQFQVTLERNQFGLADVLLEDIVLRNPYNLQVTIPNCCFPTSHLAGLRLEVDGVGRGTRTLKLESTMSELDQLLKTIQDPIEFMCQSIGLSPACKDKLDERLTREFVYNTPKSFHLLRNTNLTTVEKFSDLTKDMCEFPTLLHFSACHGLERLTSVLLECPGAREASNLRNGSDLNPTELAQINGHPNLAKQLHAFQVGVMNSHHIYDYIFQSRKVTAPETDKPTEIGPYQVPPPPRPVITQEQQLGVIRDRQPITTGLIKAITTTDPYGTLRASKRIGKSNKSGQQNPKNGLEENVSSGDDDVFDEHPNRHNSDPFGTLKAANRVVNRHLPSPTPQNKTMDDYRLTKPKKFQNPSGESNNNYQNNFNQDEVRLADELLKLLDDFQRKSYSTKEMEELFEAWKKKAQINLIDTHTSSSELGSKSAITELDQLKEKGHRAMSLISKIFARHGNEHSDEQKTRSTKNLKHFRKTCSKKDIKEELEQKSPNEESNISMAEPKPTQCNETIVEGEISILDEVNMSVIAFPPTPAKTPTTGSKEDEGISTQILPLSRLSMSGSNCSTSPAGSNFATPPPVPDNTLASEKDGSQSRPSSGVIEKIKKSLTEPLLHYFHELQVSPDSEEPEVLNTPRSVVPPVNSIGNSNSHLNNLRRRSRNLFNMKKDGYENVSATLEETEPDAAKKTESKSSLQLPPPIITDM